MKTLIINTHLTYPNWSEGKLNQTFMDFAKAFFMEHGHEVMETFVERGYDPQQEVEKHMAANLVILQTPVNWFSAPWIYKKYADEVFNAGLQSKMLLEGDGRTRSDPSRQYGTGGKSQGKKFMISATWNAPKEAFSNPDGILFGGKGTDDLFLHITSNYKFMGFDILPNYGIFDIFKHLDVPDGLEEYKQHLENYCLKKHNEIVEEKMEIKRNGSQPSNKSPADWFTGTVRVDQPFSGTEPARVGGAIVTFEPGARTAWHTHPKPTKEKSYVRQTNQRAKSLW